MILLFQAVSFLLTAMQFAIIARSLFSFIDPIGRTPVGMILNRVTDPIIVPIRRVMPSTGMIDFSPLAALLLIAVIQRVALPYLASLVFRG